MDPSADPNAALKTQKTSTHGSQNVTVASYNSDVWLLFHNASKHYSRALTGEILNHKSLSVHLYEWDK